MPEIWKIDWQVVIVTKQVIDRGDLESHETHWELNCAPLLCVASSIGNVIQSWLAILYLAAWGVIFISKWLSIGWTISISALVSVIVIWVAQTTYHTPNSSSPDLVELSAIIGGVATFGGIVTGFIGLYSLTSINERINQAIRREKSKWEGQIKRQLTQHFKAFSEYNKGISTADIRESSEHMEQALIYLPGLPLVEEYMGFRFADATFRWAYDQINPSRKYKTGLHAYGFTEDLLERGDFRHDAIVWLEKALRSTEDKVKILLYLSYLHSLNGDELKSMKFVQEATRLNMQATEMAQRKLALLVWTCRDEERVNFICNTVQYSPVGSVTKQFVDELLKPSPENMLGTLRPLLAVRKRGSIMLKTEVPFSPTVYFLGKRLDGEGKESYIVQWYTENSPIRLPREAEETMSIDNLVVLLNDLFVTIGGIQHEDGLS
ncbi:hypothetical protein JZ785_18755 [Alicyclobacillus curvatus]|nr:hypothetical protein JZ785_18755 [Alicyclobacillus curvatus]